MKIRDGLILDGEELVSTGCGDTGQWACIGPVSRCGWEWRPAHRTIQLQTSDIVDDIDTDRFRPLLGDTRTPEQIASDWAQALKDLQLSGRRWVVCRKQLGEDVKWDNPGFRELYESIKE